jgi:RimJ/RimL family protein N-acetyltransferase
MPFQVSHEPYDRRFMLKSREWFADEELRALTATPVVSPEAQEKWFASLPKPGYHIWGSLVDGEPIGAFGLKNEADGQAEYWAYIGDKNYWGKGIGRYMLEAGLEEGRRLGLKKVYIYVLPDNMRTINLHTKLGFVQVPELAKNGFLHMEVEL